MSDRGNWWRLAGLMALLYAVQGAFWPLLAVHLQDLGIGGRWRGAIFATLALGSFAMPMGAGQLVDRLMPAQRYLSLAYAVGTGLLAVMAMGVLTTPRALFGLFLLYWLIIAPTSGLATALALRNLARPQQQFGAIRAWGTGGWMAVGWLVTAVLAITGSAHAGHGAYEAFGLAAVISAILSVFCLSLPDTPPLAVGSIAASGPRGAASWCAGPWSRSFSSTAFGVCLTTPFIYQVMPSYFESRGLPRAWISSVMTLGQYPEVAALAALPWMFRRFGYKGTMLLGIVAYAVRYVSLALDPPLWLAIAGIPLHGLGVAFFTVGGQVYFDSLAPGHRRASAQALLMVLTSGFGSLLGSLLAGELMSLGARVGVGTGMSSGFGSENYPLVFLAPAVINLGLIVIFGCGFHPHREKEPKPLPSPASIGEPAQSQRLSGMAFEMPQRGDPP